MYTLNQLEMFKLVAETGSFNKAAEKAYVTPNAVMKHINNLEEELNITLFDRTYRGQTLTEAGESLYKNAVEILKYADKTIEEVRAVAKEEIARIRVGRSIMTPIDPLNPLLIEIRKKLPGVKFEFVNFDNSPDDVQKFMIPELGTVIDVLVDSFDDFSLKALKAEGMEVLKVQMFAVVSSNSEYAEKKVIELEDLRGKTLVYRKNMLKYIDDFIERLAEKNIDVNHKTIDAYTMDVYDEVAEGNDILLGVGNFKRTHPFLVRVPINYEKTCSFGIIYSKNPNASVKLFVQLVKEVIERHKNRIAK